MKRIVIAGEINVDLIFAGVPGLPQFGQETLAQSYVQCPGSSSMILAMGLARLGDPVRFVGRCGNDQWGEYCIGALRAGGIDTSAVIADANLRTGVTVAISSATDRALVTWPGAIAELGADDVTEAMLDARESGQSYQLYSRDAEQIDRIARKVLYAAPGWSAG